MIPTIINSTALFDYSQNGLIYLCGASDGTYWVRAVNGDWAQLTLGPVATADLDADFQANQAKVVTASQIQTDDTNPSPTPEPPTQAPPPIT